MCAAALSLVIDSGCTWHVHPNRADLVNIRPCTDTMKGVDDVLHKCEGLGDLPIVAKDRSGSWR